MKRRIFEKIAFSIFTLLMAFSLLGLGLYIDLKDDLPQLPDSLEKINLSLPTEIYSSQGNVIKVLGQRHPVPLDEISPRFTEAMIATEDSRFYSHSGVDHIGLTRAMLRNIRKMRSRKAEARSPSNFLKIFSSRSKEDGSAKSRN